MENLLTTNGEAFISSYAHMCRHRSELLIQGLDDIRWVKGIGISVSPVWIKTAPAKLQITLKIWFTNFNKCHAFDFLCHPSFYGTQIAHIAPCPKWSLRGGGGLHHPPPREPLKPQGATPTNQQYITRPEIPISFYQPFIIIIRDQRYSAIAGIYSAI